MGNSGTKFTPGPWTVVQRDWADGYGFWWEILAHDAETTVCELADTALPDIAWQSNPMGEIPPAENLMNAHLVAAAPDLYEALRDLESAVMRWGIEVTDEMAGEGDPDRGATSVTLFDCIQKARTAMAKAEGRNAS